MRRYGVADESGERRGVARIRDASDLPPAERLFILRNEHPRWLVWVALGWAAGMVGLFVLMVVNEIGVGTAVVAWAARVMSVVVGVTTVVGIVAVPVRSLLGLHARSLANAWLGLGRCAWCAYPLEGSGAGPDGVCVCSECGGRWRVEKTGT